MLHRLSQIRKEARCISGRGMTQGNIPMNTSRLMQTIQAPFFMRHAMAGTYWVTEDISP